MDNYHPRHRSISENSDLLQDRWAERIAVAERTLSEAEVRFRSIGAGADQVRTAFAIARDCIAEAREISSQARRELKNIQYELDLAIRNQQNSNRYTGAVAPVIPDVPGMDMCPDPSSAQTASDYMEILRMYRIWAGKPSYRLMENRCGRHYAASTIHSAINGRDLPSLDMIQAIITACGGTDKHRQAFATALRRLTMPQQNAFYPSRHRDLHPVS